RRPEDRWQSAAQFRDAIDEWLRRTTRVGQRDLAQLIGAVINAPTADLEPSSPHTSGIIRAPSQEEEALSGPMTRMSIARAEAEAAAARAEYIAGDAIPDGEQGGPGSSGTMVVGEDDLIAEQVEVPSGPREVGDIKEHPVLRTVYRLAKGKGTGMLALEGRAGVLKEAYLLDGQPQFVNSNVEGERLGAFLIAQGALTPPQLQRALAVMHHFGGRLADTLVGLDILDPLEAY